MELVQQHRQQLRRREALRLPPQAQLHQSLAVLTLNKVGLQRWMDPLSSVKRTADQRFDLGHGTLRIASTLRRCALS